MGDGDLEGELSEAKEDFINIERGFEVPSWGEGFWVLRGGEDLEGRVEVDGRVIEFCFCFLDEEFF